MEECPFARFGCDSLVDDVAAHRKRCEYRPVDCPLGCDALLRHNLLESHMRDCANLVLNDSPNPNAFLCGVPGCGVVPRRHESVHEMAQLRHHIELLLQCDSLVGHEQSVKNVLRDALSMWPADLCVACKQAEGDTVACRDCERFLHEDCDGADNNMHRHLCFLCARIRPVDAGGDQDDDRDAEGGAIDLLRDEDRDSDGEEEEEERNLTGFVVDDDHVSFSSGSDALAGVDEEAERSKKRKIKKKFERDPSDEEEHGRGDASPPKPEKKRSKFVIDSPAKDQSQSGSARAQAFLDLASSSSDPSTPKKKKKKKKKKDKSRKEGHQFDDDDDFK